MYVLPLQFVHQNVGISPYVIQSWPHRSTPGFLSNLPRVQSAQIPNLIVFYFISTQNILFEIGNEFFFFLSCHNSCKTALVRPNPSVTCSSGIFIIYFLLQLIF